MAKITRKTQKVFAGSASNNGVFGSAQLGTKVLSNDLATLQGLSAWDNGWVDAVLTGLQLPPLEEDQTLHYVATKQLAYIFQEGVAEYDSGTTYFQKSIVKKTGTYQIYGSLTDNNTGNPLTDAVNWALLQDLSNPVGTTNPLIWCGTAGGTSSALTLTPSTPLPSYAAGQPIAFLGGATPCPSGGVTVNVSGLGAVALKRGGTVACAANDILPGKLYVAIDDGTNFQLLNPPPFAQATDIASATTLVLDDVGGDIVNVTGNTAITAVTLRQGRFKVLKFTGTPVLTNGASLIVPGGSYTCSAGDYAFAIGYAAGVVQLLIMKADGTAVVAGSATTYAANTVVANATTGTAAPTGIALSASNLLGRGSSGNVAAITLDSTLALTGTVLGLTAGAGSLKAVQFFSSSGTYTKTTGATKALVFVQGGGGGGGAPGLTGGAGGNTTISSVTANGGGAGFDGNNTAAAGGTSSGGDVNLTGSKGGQGLPTQSSNGFSCGGSGGVARLFGGFSGGSLVGTGGVATPVTPVALPANCGSGGGGLGTTSGGNTSGNGGASGGLGIKLFDATTLSGSSVTIGAAGTAGTGAATGSAGYVLILEFS